MRQSERPDVSKTHKPSFDPDLVSVAALAFAGISAVGTVIQVLVAVLDKPRRDLPPSSSNAALRNIADAADQAASAVMEIETLVEVYQQRTLSNHLDRPTRFGSSAPEFDTSEFDDFKAEDQRLFQAVSKLRSWSLHMVKKAQDGQYQNESLLIEELHGLTEQCNVGLFEQETIRKQLKIITESFERIHRAYEGARRRKN